jgi:hypothetical protein
MPYARDQKPVPIRIKGVTEYKDSIPEGPAEERDGPYLVSKKIPVPAAAHDFQIIEDIILADTE